MVSFKKDITPQDADEIRAYVVTTGECGEECAARSRRADRADRAARGGPPPAATGAPAATPPPPPALHQ